MRSASFFGGSFLRQVFSSSNVDSEILSPEIRWKGIL